MNPVRNEANARTSAELRQPKHGDAGRYGPGADATDDPPPPSDTLLEAEGQVTLEGLL